MVLKLKKRKMAWLEIETKVKIDDSEVKKIRDKIKKISVFVKSGVKGDDYFAIRRKGYPKKAFRIRAMNGNYEINFKKWLKKYWTKDIVVKEEFEFELASKEQLEDMIALFKDLGFVEWVKKIKRNETYSYKKDKRASIEINHVKHLGYFMEIEYLAKKNEVEKARGAIRKILKELEISKEKINNTGYTKMLWDKGIKDKRYFIK